MEEDRLVDVVAAVGRAVEVMLREVQHLRDDVRDLHADIVQRDDIRHLARRVATSDQLDRVAEQLAALVTELQRSRAHTVEPVELPAPPSTFSADVSDRLRRMSGAARELGNGLLHDFRNKRGRQ